MCTLINGYCETELKTIQEGTVDLVIFDPPYDISVGNVAWDKVSDYMCEAKKWLNECVRILRPGGALMVYGSPCRTWVSRMTVMLVDVFDMNHVQDMAWVYTQGGDSRLANMTTYAVRHEHLVWFEKKPSNTQARTFNPLAITEQYSDCNRALALAKGKGRVTNKSLNKGKPPRTFIDIPRENSRSKERKYGKHPSMKPLVLCERIIKAHTNENDSVVVPFAGSGSEVVASIKLNRNVVGVEKSLEYVSMIKRRLEGHGILHKLVNYPC